MFKSIIACTAAATLAFSLAVIGAPKRTADAAATPVAAEAAQTYSLLTEQEAVRIAFETLGITESDGVVAYQVPGEGIYAVTIMLGADAHFLGIDDQTGAIIEREDARMGDLAIDGARAEELAEAADPARAATNYKAMYDMARGWGWRVTCVGGGELRHLFVSGATGQVALIDSIAG